MRAYVYSEYGPPEVLSLVDMDAPVPGEDDVQIRVRVTTVTATDCTFRRGEPRFSRLFTGLTRPKAATLGSEFAGEVVKVGTGVERFSVGDRVVGTTPGNGAWVETLALTEGRSTLALIPDGIGYEQAVACCDGFLTALPFLRDRGRVSPGMDVMVVGASGSVGSAAVQTARHLGASVTGVCSSANVELVASLGAESVVDYTREDLARTGRSYDVIFDAVGKTSFGQCRDSLKPGGRYLQAGIQLGVFPTVIRTALFGSRRAMIMATGLRAPADRTRDLEYVAGLLSAGDVVPVIDRRYAFDDMVEANRYVDTGHKKGNVVVTVDGTA